MKKDIKDLSKELFSIFYNKPMSRRMAVTELGKPDQTYVITNQVYKLLKTGKAQVIKIARCERSGRLVQFITTNPKNFIEPDTSQFVMPFTS